MSWIFSRSTKGDGREGEVEASEEILVFPSHQPLQQREDGRRQRSRRRMLERKEQEQVKEAQPFKVARLARCVKPETLETMVGGVKPPWQNSHTGLGVLECFKHVPAVCHPCFLV